MSNFLLQSGGGFFTLQDGSGVLLLQSTTTGTTASGSIDTVSLTAPTATVSFDNTSSGSVDATLLTAVSGTASFSNSSSGSIDTVSLTAPDASTSTGDTGVGSIDVIDLSAPTGTASSDSTSSGSFDTITLSAPTGTGGGDATASGSIDEIILGEQNGTASFTGSASTSIDAISLTAPDAVGSSGDTGAGSIDLIDLTAIAATTSYSSSASGSIDAITLSAPTGNGGSNVDANASGSIDAITLSALTVDVNQVIFEYSDLLNESPNESNDRFGRSVSLSSNGLILAVGIPNHDAGAPDSGAVNIYDRVSGAWVFRNTVASPSPIPSGVFGNAVALSGDGSVLISSAYNENLNKGYVYTFDWDGSNWTQRTGSRIDGSVAGERFGYAVGLSSDGIALAIGAPLGNTFAIDQGYVNIYDWSGTAWVQRGISLTNSDGLAGDEFGSSVAISGDSNILFVGAVGVLKDSFTNSGAVYVYDVNGTGWDQRGSRLTSPTSGNDKYGFSVATNNEGSLLFIGQDSFVDVSPNTGAAYLYRYHTPSSSWIKQGSTYFTPESKNGHFGSSIWISSDSSLAVIGAPQHLEGTVYTYFETLNSSNSASIDSIALTALDVIVSVDNSSSNIDSINLGEISAIASTDSGIGIGYIDSISIGELTAVASSVFDISPTVISQYANSPIILQLVSDMMIYFNANHQRNEFIRNIWDVRTANSQGLDIWGRIVGISRYLTLTNQDYFGFDPDFDPFNNSPFFAGNNVTNTFILGDEDYRRVILAKASANITNCTIPGIENTLNLLFGERGATWVDVTGDHELTYVFNFVPTELELAIINAPKLIPRPAGFTIIYDYLT